ncbi:MAG: hypothetical protein CVV64_17475 [Candidatus Wallbacteria bacterium HGW-Wallbacteria-1]|jgi:hypothetical protein|uniref:DUF401 domain-containing protein n=1 Tax=Candidatus Wallbacteria bacterium HGW-Wallbacteria-1 TaxID=2013854 RepID=A0A2N1PKA1_9BACT|nr:MAG: hypothetical protein CVV64_17475 [Candidatus Wallbacteria bacterium HGW-Wallbacteria-1]
MEEWQFLLLKTTAPLAVVLVAGRFALPLSISLFLAGLTVSWLFDFGFSRTFQVFSESILSSATLTITLAVALIAVFNGLLGHGDRLRRVADIMERTLSSMTARLAFFPVLIGLLPMPGGAVFSAPMVDAVAAAGMRPIDRAVVNYWFRHCCEYCWPLYPSLVLLAALTGWPISRLALAFIPVSLAALLLGWLYILLVTFHGRKNPEHTVPESIASDAEAVASSVSGFGPLAAELWPLITVIILFSTAERYIRLSAVKAPAGLSLVISMTVTLLIMVGLIPGAMSRIRATVSRGNFWSLTTSVIGIMYFKEAMGASGVAASLSTALPSAGHARIAALIFTFVSGLVLGYCPGMVGTAFPLVVKVIPQVNGLPSLSWILSAFAVGFAGVLMSPAHLCIILTRDYFQASTAALWARSFLLTFLIVSFALIYAFAFLGP